MSTRSWLEPLRRLGARVLGARGELQRLRTLVDAINAGEDALVEETGPALRRRADSLREAARSGAAEEDLLVPTFALVREAARRAIGQRAYDLQLLAAVALQEGRVVELANGEGKTLAGVFPAALAALGGRGAHVLTLNDYLARRDAAAMGPTFLALGLRAAAVQSDSPPASRTQAWDADVTYAPAVEAGFDHLRDRLALSPGQRVQRPLHFVVLDEADSLLIDEARIPLVISRPTRRRDGHSVEAAEAVRILEPELDFTRDESAWRVDLTERGTDRVERALGCRNLYDDGNTELLTAVNLALHVRGLIRRDVHYIVRDGQVALIDAFTGRVAAGRRWPDGLHAAVEAAEGLAAAEHGHPVAAIALGHFARLYPRSCGMSGTVRHEADELRALYGLRSVALAPRLPPLRLDQPDRIYARSRDRDAAVLEEIVRVHRTGRPILVGTPSAPRSEELAAKLCGQEVSARVLNALNEAEEAAILAVAGSPGAVTIVTNLAGRGVDIRPGEGADDLYVLGVGRYESRRADDQLRGRTARQGRPGETRFFVSLEDDLFERFGFRELVPRRVRESAGSGPLNDPRVQREVGRSQRILEGRHFDRRRRLSAYADVLEKQRTIVHARRDALVDAGCGVAALRRIDALFADHLERLTDLRDASGLVGLLPVLGTTPDHEFLRRATDLFATCLAEIDSELERAVGTEPEAGPGVRAPDQPGAHWGDTFTSLVDDDPFGAPRPRLRSKRAPRRRPA